MWRCSKCETDNRDEDVLCNGCDWHAPELQTFASTLLTEESRPVYSIAWKFINSVKLSISHGVGDMLPLEGESLIEISKETQLVLSAENEYTVKKFTKVLTLPVPVIERFEASSVLIHLGKAIVFSWKVKYANKIILSEGGDVTSLETAELMLDKACSITLKVENASGFMERTLNFVLPAPLIRYFKAEPAVVMEGDAVMLSWETENAATLTLSGLPLPEEVKGNHLEIKFSASAIVILNATNRSGAVSASVAIEVVPRLKINYLQVDPPVALAGQEIVVKWEVINFSRITLQVGGDITDVSDRTEFRFIAAEDQVIQLACESLRSLAKLVESVPLKVVEHVKIHHFTASSRYTIQTKPISLSWKVQHATTIMLFPGGRELMPEGSVEVLPDARTTYRIEAKNEITTSSAAIEIDVLPLPVISRVSLVLPPPLSVPVSYDESLRSKSIGEFHRRFWNAFGAGSNPVTNSERGSVKTGLITFSRRKISIGITKEYSLFDMVRKLKSINKL